MKIVSYKFHNDGTVPTNGEIFVFGSNQNGYHGAGAALEACKNFGAPMGYAEGLYGQSYAIPTKDGHFKTLPMTEIKAAVHRFVDFAKENPQQNFFVTRVGCGYAGLSNRQMAQLFVGSPENCSFAKAWKPYMVGED